MRTVFALTAGLALATPAHALSCADWYVVGALPADGTLGVPSNARVAVQVYSWYDDQAEPVLFDADENIIETTVEMHDAGTDLTFFLTPVEPLAPGDYTVTVASAWEGGADEHVTGFTVSDELDTTSPISPTVTDITADHDNDEWGDWYSVNIEMPEQNLDDNGVLYQWTVHDISTDESFTRYTLTPEQGLSHGPCSSDVAATINKRNLVIDIAAVDVAGNSSDDVQWVCGTGCNISGSAPVGVLFTLLPLAAMRRRRTL